MRILYPLNPLKTSEADLPYQAEFVAVQEAGIPVSLFDFDFFQFEGLRPKPRIEQGEFVLYRGWMKDEQGYKALETGIGKRGGRAVTSIQDYLKCHHLPNWYEVLQDYTAKTRFCAIDQDLTAVAQSLGWPAYFVKDFVKSNTTSRGSVARSPAEVADIAKEIASYRGDIEGGIALRQFEDYRPETEERYFVVQGQPHRAQGPVPSLVEEIAKRITAPFFSLDIIETKQGDLRLVELGDGQVSDKKSWPLTRFIEVLKEASLLWP